MGGDFDLEQFKHAANYNEGIGCVEISVVSQTDQVVRLNGESFSFREGEAICTEYSHKYTIDGFAAMAERAGFHVERVWTDAEQLFSVQYCVRL